jgi:ABC-type sugar transport system ATPase subunit
MGAMVMTMNPTPQRAKGLTLNGVSKSFGSNKVINTIDLEIKPGDILAVTGSSGAGKSTLARLISGLESCDTGSIRLGQQEVQTFTPQARGVAHMFESYALYPNRTVFENVASPLISPTQRGKFTTHEVHHRIEEVLHLTEIHALKDRLPSQLSGGQKQRVALCRTLVQDPQLYILDEPIGHLDAKLKHKLRGEIKRRLRLSSQPSLWLTPDAIEAMSIATEVAVLINGRIAQRASPFEIFTSPANVEVAKLVGDPCMNIMALPNGDLIGCRPHHLTLNPTPDLPTLGIEGHVYTIEPFGKYTLITASLHGDGLHPRHNVGQDLRPIITCKIAGPMTELAHLIVGQPITFHVLHQHLLNFNPQTGVLLK